MKNTTRFLPTGLVIAFVLASGGAGPTTGATANTPPKVGAAAPPLSLDTIDGKHVDLAELQKAGPVVVVELRGWVGYQCPICTRQAGEFLGKADAFKQAGATVVFVYPGPAEGLKQHAEDFVAGKGLPDHFRFVLDPGLRFVDAWGVRWDKKGETAYPATFVVDPSGKIRFVKVSHTHGDRAASKEVLDALPKK